MTFPAAVVAGFRGYVRWNGRATRAEYWWWYLFALLSAFALVIPWVLLPVLLATQASTFTATPAPPSNASILAAAVLVVVSAAAWVAIALPSLSVQVRRLHDIGRSAAWALAYVAVVAMGNLIAGAGYAIAIAAATASPDAPQSGLVLPVLVGGLAGLVSWAFGVLMLVFALLPSTSRPTRWDSGYRPFAA